MSEPRSIQVQGAQLCVQAFGRPADPALLLIAGGASAMDWWETAFCERLAEAGRFVLRYDQRDTGQSTHAPVGHPGYSMNDLVHDAFAVLDAFDIAQAQVVGLSMGATVAMRMALEAPRRVSALALISASPGGPKLPPMSPALAAYFEQDGSSPDWHDRDAVVEHLVGSLHAFGGKLPLDEAAARTLAGRVFDRSEDMSVSETNHWLVGRDNAPLRDRLKEIAAPTLVLHGTDDPLYPAEHGRVLAREIPGARLVLLDGMGHEVPPRVLWDQVIATLAGALTR
jgi:pimeloyl-ACP methyl ester carboxylesterase